MLQIQLLGDFVVSHNGQLVGGLAATRPQSLLAFLLVHRGIPQSREHLAFTFWPDSVESQALNNLRKVLHQLRQKLPDVDGYLQTDTRTIMWRADGAYALDCAAFEQEVAAANGERLDIISQRRHLMSAVAHYQGELLPGVYDDWVIEPREQMRTRFETALAQLINLLESQRDFAEAIRFARLRVRRDALDEGACRHLMELHMAIGDPSAALRVYHACAAALQRDLATSPSLLTDSVYQQLVNHAGPTVSHDNQGGSNMPLIGRGVALAQMQAAWNRAARGETHCMLVSGDAGMGKTHLIEAFCNWATQYDFLATYTRAYAAEGALAFAPVATWLRSEPLRARWHRMDAVWLTELARVLPEIRAQRPDVPAPASLTDNWQRKQLFEALARAVLSVERPLILVLDDMQWCDRDTLEWLHFLMRFDPSAPLLVVLGLRHGEIVLDQTAVHPAVTLIDALRASQSLSQTDLAGFDAGQVAALANHITSQALPQDKLDQLFADTQGNPLFVVEMLRAGLGQLQGAPSAPQASIALPPKIQAMIRGRLGTISPNALAIVNVAAIIGREFSPALLAELVAADMSANALTQGLDELWQRRILREQGMQGYDFSHDRIRDVVIAGMQPAQRRVLHRAVADALFRLHANDLDAVCKRLAGHYVEAGAFAMAIPHYQRAIHIARSVFALDEELALLKKSLGLFATFPQTHELLEQRLSLLLSLGQVREMVHGAASPDMRETFEAALPLSVELRSDLDRYRVQRGLWVHYLNAGQAETARHWAGENLVLGRAKRDDMLIGEAERSMAMAEWMLGDFSSAHTHNEDAVRRISLTDAAAASARFELGMDYICASAAVLWFKGYPDQAMRRARQGMDFCRSLKMPYATAVGLEYMGFMAKFLRRPQDTAEIVSELVATCEKYGFSSYGDLGRMQLGWHLAQNGQVDKGLAIFYEGVNGCLKSNTTTMLTFYLGMLAEMRMMSGELAAAQSCLNQAFELAEQNQERYWLSELHRLQGTLSISMDMPVSETEQHFLNALFISRRQGTRALELRAVTSLARLWHLHDNRAQAYELLFPAYSWFGEGFGTRDLADARALLDELQPATRP